MGRRRPESNPEKCLGRWAGHELYGKCSCGQERRLAIAPLARRFGANTHITYVEQFLTCQCCGRKGIALMVVAWDEKDPSERIPY
jgi:hypothetical protein